jgi:uncharacterized integral membrane protein (TIGR00698 family)
MNVQSLIHAKKHLLGITLCVLIAMAAKYISLSLNWPVMLTCLACGFALNPFCSDKRLNAGINFSAKTILRLGVVLIGARFVFSDLAALGAGTILFIIAVTFALIIISIIAAKMLKIDASLGILLGGATAICGASAAMAIAAILPQHKDNEHNTAAAIIAVTAIGTAAMVLYPLILPFFNLADQQAALFIGGTIHDVAQVVGAGYSLSPEIGDQAVLVKLIRVFMLIPVLITLGFYIHKTQQNENKNNNERGGATKFTFPLFLLGFLTLLTLNALGFIPDDLRLWLKAASHWALIIALSAVGLKTSLKALCQQGAKPFTLVAINSAVLIAIYGLYISFL